MHWETFVLARQARVVLQDAGRWMKSEYAECGTQRHVPIRL